MEDERRNGNGRRGRDDLAVTVGVIANDVTHIKTSMDKLVTREEFDPVRKIVYGAVGLILFAVMAGLVGMLLL